MKANSGLKQGLTALFFIGCAFLLLFLGIRAAGAVLSFAKTQQIEMTSHLVEGMLNDPASKIQPKKIQDILLKYVAAFAKAVAEFEFMPRKDAAVLATVIASVPSETEVLGFSYHGRNLTIHTRQPSPEQLEAMAASLEKSGQFEQVVTSYYIHPSQACLAEISLLVLHYDETNLKTELQKVLADA